MVQVPTQIFVENFFVGAALSCFWWYYTRFTINVLNLLAKDPSNFVKVAAEEEVEDTDAEDSNTVADTLGCGVSPQTKN